MIKSRETGWAGYAVDMRNAYIILMGKPEGKRPFGRPRLDRMIISEWILQK
jgi:hypothetical protein